MFGAQDFNMIIDSPEAVGGMPVSLQLVGRRLEEEKVVAMTRRVLESLGRGKEKL